MNKGEGSKGNSLSNKIIKSTGVNQRFYTLIGVEVYFYPKIKLNFVSESTRWVRGLRGGNRTGLPCALIIPSQL